MGNIIIDWHRAFLMQKCPKARDLQYRENVERRVRSVHESLQHHFRAAISLYLDSAYTTPAGSRYIADQARRAFLVDAERGLGYRDGLDVYAEAKRDAEALYDTVGGWCERWGSELRSATELIRETHEVSIPLLPWANGVDFHARLLGIMKEINSGTAVLLFARYKARLERSDLIHDMHFMTDFYVANRLYGVRHAIIYRGCASPLSIEYSDLEAEEMWRDIGLQEQRLFLQDDYQQAKYRHSCQLPYKCPFYATCWEGLTVADALSSGVYVPREPRLAAEQVKP